MTPANSTKKTKKIVMIDNFDSFTYNLVDYFKQTGAGVTVYRNTAPVTTIAAEQPDLVVYSPGPGKPSESGYLCDYIRYFSKKHIPQFGVCLGLQAMVEVFGGSLRVLPRPIHGRASLIDHDGTTIFQGLPNPMEVGRYHSLAADTVPTDFTVSATTHEPNNGTVVMALRHTTLPIEAVQFHPESVLTFKQQAGLKLIFNVVHQL